MNKFTVAKGAAKSMGMGFQLKARDARGRYLSVHSTKQDAAIAAGDHEQRERAARMSVVLNNLDKYNPAYKAELLAIDVNDPKATTITKVMESEDEFVRLLKQ